MYVHNWYVQCMFVLTYVRMHSVCMYVRMYSVCIIYMYACMFVCMYVHRCWFVYVTYDVFPPPVGPMMAFKPGPIIPLKL